MKTNKRKKNTIRYAFYIKTISITFLFALLGILYVWQNVQAVRIGYAIKKKERTVADLQKKQRALDVSLARLKMPQVIKKNLAINNIDLAIPHSWQIVKLSHVPLYYSECYAISTEEIICTESKIGKTLISIPHHSET